MVDDCILAKVLDEIKEKTGTEKFDNSKILIDTNDKLPDDTLKNVILMTRGILSYSLKDVNTHEKLHF